MAETVISSANPGRTKAGRKMNPYEATLTNVVLRLGAWVRGMVRYYRRPLLVMGAAAVTMVVGVSATDAPRKQPAAQVASR